MHKKMTITLDEAVYEGLWRTIGKRKMSHSSKTCCALTSWASHWIVELQRKVSHYLQPILSHQFLNNLA